MLQRVRCVRLRGVGVVFFCFLCFLKSTFSTVVGKDKKRGHLLQLECNEAGAVVNIETTTRLPGECVVLNAIESLG